MSSTGRPSTSTASTSIGSTPRGTPLDRSRAAPEPGQFAVAPCPPQLTGEVRITCGTLTITGAAPASIAVAVVHALRAPARADPIVFIHGGPGGQAVTSAGDLFLSSPLSVDRDVIVFDQRGNGLSTPSYECDVQQPGLAREALARSDEDPASLAVQRASNAACASQLRERGIDPAGLSTALNARDTAALRRAMGIASWNVYGSSYGTRIALTLLRDDPSGVRSVILDSTVPIDQSFFDPERSVPGLEALFRACTLTPECEALHPDLRASWTRELARLRATPKTLVVPGSPPTTVLLDPERFVYAFYLALHAPSNIPKLPDEIDSPNAELDAAALAAETVPPDGTPDLSAATRSVVCNEQPFSVTSAPTDDEVSGGWPARSHFAHDCSGWPVRAVPASDLTNPRSDVPVLLVNGELDPNTPVVWADRVARTLTHSSSFLFPGQTHQVLAAGGPCPNAMAVAFLDAPNTRPDDSCIAQMPVPLTGLRADRGPRRPRYR